MVTLGDGPRRRFEPPVPTHSGKITPLTKSTAKQTPSAGHTELKRHPNSAPAQHICWKRRMREWNGDTVSPPGVGRQEDCDVVCGGGSRVCGFGGVGSGG